MLGGMAAKWRWRAKREAEGKPTDKPNMVCGPVQVVWHKFARYWDIEMREIPMSPGKYCMDVEQMLAQVDENTIMVVPTFGVTYTGSYEPVLELSQALDKLAADTGLDIDIHVDGASGAFLAPFCAPDVVWDFRIPRVKSISTSGHKFGLAPLGVGWVLWRDKEDLPDDLIFHVTYLGGDMPVFQINFSRPAGQIVAQYYNFVRLGREGYRAVHDACYDTSKFLAEEIVKLGPFELLCDGNPLTGIPSVAWRINEGAGPRVHALRRGRPASGQGMAGAGLPAHRIGVRHLRPANPGPPGGDPRPGRPVARRHPAVHRALCRTSGVSGDDQRGVRRLRTPLSPGSQDAEAAAMAPSGLEELGEYERVHLVTTGLRAVGTAALLLVLYYLLPIEHRAHQEVALRLAVALALFVAVLVNEVRLIAGHDRPMLRAAVAMATIIPLFLVLFAWIYLTMSHSQPATFGGQLSRTSALYFTVSVFSTVGFGDITAKTDPARLVVTVQMLADLAVVAVVIRLILGAAARGTERRRGEVG